MSGYGVSVYFEVARLNFLNDVRLGLLALPGFKAPASFITERVPIYWAKLKGES